MLLAIIVGVLFVGYGTAYVASEDVRYLTRAGFEESRILQARRPIDKMVSDPGIDPQLRSSLQLVLEARDYAAEIGLEAKDTYTTFADVERDTLLLLLTAAPRNRLVPHTWKYPIVGRVPYKGFFDFDMAHQASARLASRGFDTYLRPSAAFSTLGWFNDPLLSTALSRDPVELASLVFHEITHNTYYASGATAFNESLAQLVGYMSAAEFFEARGDSAAAKRARDRWHDDMVLSDYYSALFDRLDSLYFSEPDSAELDTGREAAGRWAGELLDSLAPEFRTLRFELGQPRPINNARLVGAMLYRTDLRLFDRWFLANGSRVNATVSALLTALGDAEGDEVMARFRAAVERAEAAPEGEGGQPGS